MERKNQQLQKVNARCGNVVENKGPLWKTQGLSGNVIENKGSYAQKAGMSLKRKEVNGRSKAVGGGRTGSRCQVPGVRG